MALPSETWTEIATTTLHKYSAKLADNVANHNILLKTLKDKKNIKTVDGGEAILENLMYAENSTSKWYSGYEVLSVAHTPTMTSAVFDWKQHNVNVTFSGLDTVKNAGRAKVHDQIAARIRNAEITAKNQIGAALFYSNTESDGKALGGLQHIVADAPSSGTVGGIDASAEAWWRNQVVDLSSSSYDPATTPVHMQYAMDDLYLACVRGSDAPDLAVAGITYFNYYLKSLQAQQRFTGDGGQTVGSGFRGLKFWGGSMDVYYDANCSATRMYFLNTDYIHFRPHEARNFTMADRKAAVNQDATVIPLYWAGNMTVSNRSLQGVIIA